MNQTLKYSICAMQLMASLAFADGNKRERVFVATADTLKTNVSTKYLVSSEGRSVFEFSQAISGRIQIKANVVTPNGETVEQSQDRTLKETIELNRTYSQKVVLAPVFTKPGVIGVTVTETKTADDDLGRPQTEVTTMTNEYKIVSGSWTDYVENGSRLSLVQTDDAILATSAQIQNEVSKQAKAKGNEAKLIRFEQSSPGKMEIDGTSMINSNTGYMRFVIEMRIPDKSDESR